MKLTKTWLSYIVWGLFSIIFFANIGISAIEIYIKNEMSDFWMPMIVLYGGTIVGIICIVGIFKLVEKYILPKIKKEETDEVYKHSLTIGKPHIYNIITKS